MRSTKGTHVYANENPIEGDVVPIKTLYIQKEAMRANPPSAITVTVEEVE